MEVKPFERLRYKVQSRREKTLGIAPWLVDLGAFKGSGKCTCEHFSMRCISEIRRLKAIGEFHPEDPNWSNDNVKCAHIRVAEIYFFREFKQKFIKQIRMQFNDYNDEDEY